MQARPLLMRALEDGNYDELVDARLGKDFNPNEIARMIACAAACVRHSARRRPRMSQVTSFSVCLKPPQTAHKCFSSVKINSTSTSGIVDVIVVDLPIRQSL
jgi:hypothetical protein